MVEIVFKTFDYETGGSLGGVTVEVNGVTRITRSDGTTTAFFLDPGLEVIVNFTREGYTPLSWGGLIPATNKTFRFMLEPAPEIPPEPPPDEVPVDEIPGIPELPEAPTEPVIPSTGNPLIDPLIQALWPIARGFISLLEWMGQLFARPAYDAIIGITAAITDAMTPGSPDKKVQARAIRLTGQYRRRLEEIASKAKAGSVDIEKALMASQQIMAMLLGAEISAEVLGTGLDQVQPLRRIGIPDAARGIMGSLGVYSLTAEIATMPARIGTVQPLEYWYNSQFTPRIPGLADLIVMLVREVITPDQYNEFAGWHGESPTWASRRWEAHWSLPAVSFLIDAYHRKLINAAERDRYIVWHDYKPDPRPGIKKSDLEIFAGLQKTLIPRVDVRRGWEYDLISDAGMLERYEWLGYEDDAPIMAEIQKRAALDGEINMVKRELINLFQRDLMSEVELTRAFEDLEVLRPRNWYWIVLARLRKQRVAKESLEAWEELTPEETEKIMEETG